MENFKVAHYRLSLIFSNQRRAPKRQPLCISTPCQHRTMTVKTPHNPFYAQVSRPTTTKMPFRSKSPQDEPKALGRHRTTSKCAKATLGQPRERTRGEEKEVEPLIFTRSASALDRNVPACVSPKLGVSAVRSPLIGALLGLPYLQILQKYCECWAIW